MVRLVQTKGVAMLPSKTPKYPNPTMKLLIERASCRSFTKKKVPFKVAQLILEAGIHAPTGGNLQPYSIIRIESPKLKQKLAEMCGQDFIAQAPLNLLFCIDWHRLERWAQFEVAPFTATSSFRHFWISFEDTIISAQNICTAADSLGLGSVYIGTILECFRDIRRILELPAGVLPVVLLCLGYPKGKLHPRKKLGVDIIVHRDKYRGYGADKLKKAFNEKYSNLKIEITQERLKRISEVCKRVHGDSFARRCLDRIRRRGYINAVQRYFGLHYAADLMPADNEEFLNILKEFGFNWFKKFKMIER